MLSRKTLILTLSLLTAALVAAAPAAAHENPNHGTIKVHDDEEVDPETRNDPHVSCDFWIQGFDMTEDEGWLVFYSIPPTSNPREEVMRVNWTADAEDPEGRFDFNEGPFTLDEGHYRVEAYVDEGHFAKSKTFWVNACPSEPNPPPCPDNVTATALANGDIQLDWDAVEGADEYRIYRAVGDEDFNSHAVVLPPETTFTDTDTEVGVTYRYMVTAVVEGEESEDCEIVEATAIPFFPSAVIGAAALVASVGAYAVFRRK